MKIVDVTSYINEELTSLDALNERYHWGERNQKIFDRFLKLESACLFPQLSLEEMLDSTLKQLLALHKDKLASITHVMYAHSLHTTYPFEQRTLEALVKNNISSNTEVMSVTQGSCASSFLALDLIECMLTRVQSDSSTPKYAILLTGDKCFHDTVQYVDQNGLFGEGCSASLISVDPNVPGIEVKGLTWTTLGGISHRTFKTSRQESNEYDRSFIPTMIHTIHNTLSKAQLQPQDINTLLPYHMSPPTFDRLVDQLGIQRNRVYRKNLYAIGHCFCGDPFINLHDYWRVENQRKHSGPILTIAAGVAGTFSAMILS
ncbi:3-oxoacyl-[acyl-carrier-protein] synthase III C-terminal domain-containing protein [Vibrio splendidus]